MNSVIETILARKSTRHFKKGRIPDEDIRLLAEAAVNAPSGMNRQEWKFVFVHNQEKLTALAAAVGEAMGRDGYNFYEPDCLLIAGAKPLENLSAADCACALENVFLAAESLGIASVWINQLCDAQVNSTVREMLTSLGLPADYVVYGAAALGYSGEDVPKKSRKENCVVIVD